MEIAKIVGFFCFFFCTIGVGLTRPNPTRYVIQKHNGETQHRMQHATRSDTPHATTTVHPAATTLRPACTTQQRRAPAHDLATVTSTGRRPREGDATPTLHLAPSRRRTSRRSFSVVCFFFFVYFFCCLTPVFYVYNFFFRFSI